jgi:GNAT superfamily N-acetyltransferase
MSEPTKIRPVTAARWDDLEKLFGERGAIAGCWCMWFRETSSEFEDNAYDGNRTAMRGLVAKGRKPGLLAYENGSPVGWVSVAPRREFGRIERSPILKRVHGADVWSVVCFYIDRHHRKGGVGSELLRAAVDFAVAQGAGIIEGYPIDVSRRRSIQSSELFVGTLEMFLKAGFEEVARRSPTRPIVRYFAFY